MKMPKKPKMFRMSKICSVPFAIVNYIIYVSLMRSHVSHVKIKISV